MAAAELNTRRAAGFLGATLRVRGVTRVIGWITAWLARPQRTNRDALVVGLVTAALIAALAYGARKGLDAIGVAEPGGDVPIWIAAIAGGVALIAGLWIGRRVSLLAPQSFELYAEHLRDALTDLRRLAAGELANFSLRDYAEAGIFQPAHRLLTTRGRKRGDVRFSVLHRDPDEPDTFTMSRSDDMYPAFGHSMEARQEFRMKIDESFAGIAFRTGRPQVSNDLKQDDRWKPHPKARRGREYESIIAVPLISGGSVDGVLNVIAERPGSFERVDQTYITLLASLIDVARVPRTE